MTTPCEQADNINNINQTLRQLVEMQVEERAERRESENRLITALEKVADQGARVDHLEDSQVRYFTDMENLFGRVRDVELNQASNGSNFRERVDTELKSLELKMKRLNTLLAVLSNKWVLAALASLAGMTIVGAALDFLFHYDMLKKILGVVK